MIAGEYDRVNQETSFQRKFLYDKSRDDGMKYWLRHQKGMMSEESGFIPTELDGDNLAKALNTENAGNP